MKKFLKWIITGLLKFRAKQVLKKHSTEVIAVTGSMGKTSTKDAIYHLLKDKFKTYASPQGFNTQLGISLAILQESESGFSSIKAWFGILKRAFFVEKQQFEKIVLEMGADQPGDIKKLMKIAHPNISIVTNVNPVHLDEGQFKDLDDITHEKETLVRELTDKDLAILNADDQRVSQMNTKANKWTIGVTAEADIRATELQSTINGLQFTVNYKDQSAKFKVPVIGEFQVYVLLPAIAVGLKMGMSLEDCSNQLKTFSLPPGRMNLIAAIKDSTLIDSSYNASPNSMLRALELLAQLEAGRKIAAIGTMNELGELTREAHLNAGKQAANVAQVLIAVGPEATSIKQGAIDAGMQERDIFTFFDAEEAGHFLKDHLKPADLILVKGSQNRVRMERLVKVVMREPDKARILLCRQEEAWSEI